MSDFITGPAGKIQLLVEHPPGAPIGVAMISHPQPLLGGSPKHIIPHGVARTLLADGWITVRPSFRGVGGSEGQYSEGMGEAEDAVLIAAHLRHLFPSIPLVLVGFSFGAHVYARTACALAEAGDPANAVVLLGLPVGMTPSGRAYEAMPIPPTTLLIHGQDDNIAPLAPVLDWARPTQHPVTVFPAADHFFKGCLPKVFELVARHMRETS